MSQFTDKLSEFSGRRIGLTIVIFILVVASFSSFYTIDTNENGVVLRFGRYSSTTTPGLHFKLPFGIDKVYKIPVEKVHKMEFGYRTSKPGIRTEYSSGRYEEESWMLTGDLNIADVMWIVQYKIVDPVAYLFKVRDVENTIRDVSETTMRLMIGDRSFQEALQAERRNIADASRKHKQEILDQYDSGISVQIVQLQDVFPPQPVADSFNEVNRAKQEEESAINKARQAYNKEIYRVEGDAERMVSEAEGYAIERVNMANGDAALFDAVLKEYKKAPQITKDRLYLETMNKIYSKVDGKIVVDKRLKNILPLLNINQNK